MRISSFIIVFLGSMSLYGQNPAASYSMSDCQLTDEINGFASSLFGGSCECGVESNGILFNGSLTEAVFADEVSSLFREDWSMTFYVKMENTGEETVDLFFMGENCGRDSIFSVRYFAAADRFRVRVSDSPNNEAQVDAQADPSTCWQYIGIVKEGPDLRVYINGELIGEESSVSDLRLNVSGDLEIASSPCLNSPANPDVKFQGVIDELEIFNQVLTEREIANRYLEPDQIVIRDTTIFLGSSVRLLTGGSCSSDFNWSPPTYLDDPTRLEPISTPEQTITYTLDVNDGDCMAVDQVRISVVSREELACGDLLMPNAFTPNGDSVNDRYGISNGFIIDELTSFEIFNRWGGRVFFTDDFRAQWDGVYKGEIAPAAPYVYLVKYTCEGESFSKTGTLHIIR